MSVSGVLIAESLLRGSPLEDVTLHVHKASRGDVGDVSAGQPLTWTFIEFGFGGGGLVAVEPSGIEDIMWGGRTDVVAVAVPAADEGR